MQNMNRLILGMLACSAAMISTAAIVAATVFTVDPQALTVSSALASEPGRSQTDCAIKCTSFGQEACSSVTYLPSTQTCVFSAAWGANFFTAAPHQPVLRIYRPPISDEVYVQEGGRSYRVIQQRFKGALSFARSWVEYEDGFKDDVDFWLGLKKIHDLTGSTPTLLRVEAVTWANKLYIAEYSGFSVGNDSTNYTMTFDARITGSSNTTSDALSYHKGMMFSTMDRDNDVHSIHCSTAFGGDAGWWFRSCSHCNPNGVYASSAISDSERKMFWKSADGTRALQSIRLMVQI